MTISSLFIRRPRLAFVVSAVITIAGLLAIGALPVAQFPDIVPPQVRISATYPGASAQAVEESNLTVQIAALRKVLGEVPGGDRWIATMPRRGYRFIAPVVAENANGIAPPPIGATRDPAPGPRADAERRQITAMSCELIGPSGRADAPPNTPCRSRELSASGPSGGRSRPGRRGRGGRVRQHASVPG